MEIHAKGPVKQIQFEAVVIRADGSVENLGVIADSDWGGKIKAFFSKEARASRKRINEANKRQEG